MSIKVVKTFEPEAMHMGSIEYGTDILETLEDYCASQNITTAWLSLLGALSEVTLAYWDQAEQKYVTKEFKGELEILNGTGNITLKDNKPFGHIHLTLSDTQFGCIGGHLIKGSTKIYACEFTLWQAKGKAPLERGLDEKTGLHLWTCQL